MMDENCRSYSLFNRGTYHCPVMFRLTVPIQTRYPPHNVRFEIADVTERLRFADASVDVVHARMTCLRVRSYLDVSLPSMTWAI